MSQHALSQQQFTGFLPTSSLRPTENTWGNEKGPAAREYQQNLVDHIQQHGMPGVIEVYHSDKGSTGSGRKQSPKLYIHQGHHRWAAAKTLGMDRVPVTVKTTNGLGRPEGLEDA